MFAGIRVGRWMDRGSLVRAAIPENQSHTVITTNDGQVSQPQQKDINIKVKTRVKFNYTKGFLHSKNILSLDN